MNLQSLFLGVIAAGFASILAAATPYQDDIAVYDHLLAQVKSEDETVRFGDVGLTPAQLRTFRARLVRLQEAATNGVAPEPEVITPAGTSFKWPSGNVYYRFDATQVGNGTITALKMQQFRDAVAEWAAFANLHFIEFTGTPPTNYITAGEDPALGGGQSNSVGMLGGEQTLHFGTGAWNRGTICHEMGHALGLFHEQQRPDRDTYVQIHSENIQGDPPPAATGDELNFVIVPAGQVFGTSYDFYSVMHYARDALSDDAGDTITMRAGFTQYIDVIGRVYDRTLSKQDRAGMAAIYGNPSTLPSAVVTNTNDSGPGSLRTAIYYAFDRSTDAVPTPTTITFNIPTSDPNYDSGTGTFHIKPTYYEVALGNGTTIDGSSQVAGTNTNGPKIVLDGSNFAALGQDPFDYFPRGLILRAANCTIKGLTITNFNDRGIEMLQGNDPNGSATTGNVIGGTSASARNIISGNATYGIGIHDATTTGNLIQGNYIGTDQTGTSAQGNLTAGIVIYLGAHGNTIGGTTAGARNVISGNANQGVFIGDAGTNNNVVQGNYIGLNAAGIAALQNGSGIEITNSAQSNTIGGTISGAGNVISGNQFDGIDIDRSASNNLVAGNIVGLNALGTAKVQNSNGINLFFGAQSNTIGGLTSGARNIVSGNQFSGVQIGTNGTNNNLVQGNFIGTDPLGTTARGNGGDGVNIYGDGPAPSPSPTAPPNTGAQSNTIGGTASGAGNVIAGNGANGVDINNPGSTGTNSNVVQGNYIGVDVNGSNALANNAGVVISGGSQFNTIGGTTTAARNVIAGNTFQGVSIGGLGSSGQAVGPSQNVVQGNYIGLNAAGGARGNSSVGVALHDSAQSNTIGGSVPGARNVIAANTFREVDITSANTTGNIIAGNYLGLDPTGTSAMVGTNTAGVGITNGAQGNTIGGTAAGSRNFIAGHQQYGIFMTDPGTTGNLVRGNTIGLNINGASVPNSFPGVGFFGNAQSNTVGGSAAGASNVISGNTNEGIAIFGLNTTTIKETFSHNSIFNNGGVGIALYDGGNNSQPAPTFSSAVLGPAGNISGTDLSGSYSGGPGTLEFFANPTGDEGQNYIGSFSVPGAGSFTAHLAAAVPAGYLITGTATDSLGNTSQFSGTFTVTSTDNGSDGMPDAWMQFYFGHIDPRSNDRSRATDDNDGDGLTNLQEFLAGTSPTNAGQRFCITNVTRSSNDLTVTWASVAGKTYRIESKDDLSQANWNLVQDQITATGASTAITNPGATTLPHRFYRAVLEP